MRYLKFLVAVFAVVLFAAAFGPAPYQKPSEQALTYIKCQTDSFSRSLHQLRNCISAIQPSDPHSVRQAILALKSCRLRYKKISFFLDYFYPQQGKLFNAPAKKEIEEPFLEYEESQSLQQVESILFGRNPELKKQELENLVLVLDESAEGLVSIYAGFEATGAQVIESMHLEMIRIMTLYIAGYDAPDLKTGILESQNALVSIRDLAGIFFQPANAESARFDSLSEQAIRYCRSADFDHFNRLIFLTEYALPMEEQLLLCSHFLGKPLSTATIQNLNAGNLFNRVLSLKINPSAKIIQLGRQLFFEKALSGNQTRSCATCHQPDKYFTDRLVANQKIGKDSPLRRNTPTLLYSSCQSAQFWDGRAVTLQEQIADVLGSPDEMNASFTEIKKRLLQIPRYQNFFRDSLTLTQIENALAAYLNTLQPMNSSFDRFAAGNHHALTLQQKNGFNLFMGKAQCGTCHFAPIFNGSTPPFFNRSEYEVLGVPGLTTSVKKTADPDLGRFERYPVSVYRRAFKTPTIRNAIKTGPYMHNGCFKTLYEVIAFYNQGGGAGIGLASPEQTLSEKKLHLSQEEISDIIAFIGSLTDNLKAAGVN